MSRFPAMNGCPPPGAENRESSKHPPERAPVGLRSVASEDLGLLELCLGDRNHLDRQSVKLLVLAPQHVVAIEGESIGVVFALICDIGLIEVRAGLVAQRLEARPVFLVERRWNHRA